MSHKMLRPFIVKVSVLGYIPLLLAHFKVMIIYLFSYFLLFHNNNYCSVFYNI